jgi:ATP-dependent protease HslVU (ClpYQ) peptidase subunit
VTVIATDGRTMAGDGLSKDRGGLICNDKVQKVRRLKDRRIMGVAGNPFDIDALEEWLNNGGDFPTLQNDEEFDLLVLELDGRVFSYAKHGRRSEELVPIAIGSGTDLAVGAMEAGASPEEAVSIACRRHTECGGEITVGALADERERYDPPRAVKG